MITCPLLVFLLPLLLSLVDHPSVDLSILSGEDCQLSFHLLCGLPDWVHPRTLPSLARCASLFFILAYSVWSLVWHMSLMVWSFSLTLHLHLDCSVKPLGAGCIVAGFCCIWPDRSYTSPMYDESFTLDFHGCSVIAQTTRGRNETLRIWLKTSSSIL